MGCRPWGSHGRESSHPGSRPELASMPRVGRGSVFPPPKMSARPALKVTARSVGLGRDPPDRRRSRIRRRLCRPSCPVLRRISG